MKRPNLVNPNLWTPFHSVPEIPIIAIESIKQISKPVPVQMPVPITRKEILQRNSFYLNLFAMMIILGISYFLYSIYLERKIFGEYLDYVKNIQEEHYPGFL